MTRVAVSKHEVVVEGFLRSGRTKERWMKEKIKEIKGENRCVRYEWLGYQLNFKLRFFHTPLCGKP